MAFEVVEALELAEQVVDGLLGHAQPRSQFGGVGCVNSSAVRTCPICSEIVFTHPTGEARCQATSSQVDKSIFFFKARTGELAGTFVLPRPQTEFENCTWHNYNVVPTSKRYVLVSGNYQSGISVVDFTNPAAAREIAFADPAPLSTTSLVLGGDWSSYWYNGHIYESDIRRGLIVWGLSDSAVAAAQKLDHLNPQTEEFSIPLAH